jgi:hypothetical protein
MIRELKAEIKNMREMDAEKVKMIEFLQNTVTLQLSTIQMMQRTIDKIVAAAASDDLPSVKACLRLVHSVPATVE